MIASGSVGVAAGEECNGLKPSYASIADASRSSFNFVFIWRVKEEVEKQVSEIDELETGMIVVVDRAFCRPGEKVDYSRRGCCWTGIRRCAMLTDASSV